MKAEATGPAIRVNWTIRAKARQILRQVVDEKASESRYVSALIERRFEEWIRAWDYLRGTSWTKPQIRAACKKLVGAELGTAQSARRVVRLALQVEVDSEIPMTDCEARALIVLAREYWDENVVLRSRLE